MEKIVKKIVKNWDKIPDEYKKDLKPNSYYSDKGEIPGLKKEEHFVVLLINRQKPSVIPAYSFDEERIGITKTGKIIWGYDSGCSCPSPWHDNYPSCYSVSKEWKEFELSKKNFDPDWKEECEKKAEEIMSKIK